jgi:hypothetical protein
MMHAGPYIERSIRYRLYRAAEYLRQAQEMETKAAELREAAALANDEAARFAEGTDFDLSAAKTEVVG